MIPHFLLVLLVHLAKCREYTSRQIGGHRRFIFTTSVFNRCAFADNAVSVAEYCRIPKPVAEVCSTRVIIISSAGSVKCKFVL